jgi:hypothetical protein
MPSLSALPPADNPPLRHGGRRYYIGRENAAAYAKLRSEMSVRYSSPSSSSSDDNIVDNAWFWVVIAIVAVVVLGGIAKVAANVRGGKGAFSIQSSFKDNGDVEGGLISSLFGGSSW